MAAQPRFEDEVPGLPWPEPGATDCEQFTAEIDEYIRQSLAGLPPSLEAISVHLESCPGCSRAYLDLFDLMTAPRVQQLMDSWIEPGAAPARPILEGLLPLCQLQLAASGLVEDLRGTARGLSIMGLVRRQLGDQTEAILVHELGLRTGEEAGDLVSRTICATDLGYIALSRNQTQEALDQFQKANQSAVELTDRESEARIRLLAGQAWEGSGNAQRAQEEYRIAAELAVELGYSAGLAAATRRLGASFSETSGRMRQVVETLSGLLGEGNRQLQELRQALTEVGEFGASRLAQLTRFYDGFLQPTFGFAPGGDRALVVNTSEEIGLGLVAGPRVDRAGNLVLTLTLDPDALTNLPEEFSIDLLFIPTNEVLNTFPIAGEERLRLQTVQGLELGARLPDFQDFLRRLGDILDREGREYQDFPRTAFTLRIWW